MSETRGEPPKLSRRGFWGLFRSRAEQQAKPPGRISQFFDRPVTRRDVLKLAGVGIGVYSLKDILDSFEIDPDRYATPEKVSAAIKYFEDIDLELPRDELYGFVFPSTKEMAHKYRELLNTKIEGSVFDTDLVIIQEKEPKTITQKFLGGIPVVGRLVGTSEDPYVSKMEYPYFLYLPPYVKHYTVVEMANVLYHEGIHLFFQKGSPSGPEDTFNREIMPNIADILIDNAMQSRGEKLVRHYTGNIEAYNRAIAEGDRAVWERHIKELYKLPQNCCTYQPLPPQNP